MTSEYQEMDLKSFPYMMAVCQAWSMWTWEPVGEVKLRTENEYIWKSLWIDGSRVRICSSRVHQPRRGGTLGFQALLLSHLTPSTGRPCLDLIGGMYSGLTGSVRIKDIITGKVVFQLSGRYAKAQ
jgi:hypothetical protein